MSVEIGKEGLRFRPLLGIGEISPEDDLAAILAESAERSGVELSRGVLVLCQKVISKAEGRMIHLNDSHKNTSDIFTKFLNNVIHWFHVTTGLKMST